MRHELELSERAHDITIEQLITTQAERNKWKELCEKLLNEMDAAEWCSPMQEEAREMLNENSNESLSLKNLRPEYERQLIIQFIEWMRKKDYELWGATPEEVYKLYKP